ncbi:MAG: hypothetical protein ACRDQ2_10785, partial [Gaiellales bacterium]
MDRILKSLGTAMLAFVLATAAIALARPDEQAETRHGFRALEITPAIRRAGLRFASDTPAPDREWIRAAIAHARPEARRLIDEVDGLVEMRTQPGPIAMPDGGRAVGLTESTQGSFRITLDSATLSGHGAFSRDVVVLHEFGHVVDVALIPADLAERLDAGIPRTGRCLSATQHTGACTAPQERFADTFANWALRGGVSAVAPGYG